MSAFEEIRFPTDISLRSSGGPERLTRIVTLASGHEERSTPWSQARRHFDAGYGIRSLNDIHQIITFFEARMGRLIGFRWKDWTDFRSCPPEGKPQALDQEIGIGDGEATEFFLSKTYGQTTRPIRKPVEGSVLIAIDGAPVWPEVDHDSGLVRFQTPPAIGASVTAGFEFDVPVRFDTDRLDIDLAGFDAGAIQSIPLIEIRI